MKQSTLEVLDDSWNYTNKRTMIGLSGGINSAAVLIYLAEKVIEKPKELFLFYAHFDEHSPDTEKFVHELVEYAKGKFEKVTFTQTNNSINSFFTKSNMIPHPMSSPCTRLLNEPIATYMAENKIDVDLVGYVRTEQRRIDAQIKRNVENKTYPIAHMDDQECFDLVEEYFGWYPEIYKLMWSDDRIIPFIESQKNNMPEKQYNIVVKYATRGYGYSKNNLRVFNHNNCLPCKNMQTWEYYIVKCFFPEFFERAMNTAKNLTSFTGKQVYWGRNADELNDTGESAACTFCAFD